MDDIALLFADKKKHKMVDRNVNWEKVMLAFFIATFLFCFGIFAGYLTKGIIEGTTISIADSTRNEIASLETVLLLGNSCETNTLNLVSDKLSYIGDLISTLESKKGKKDIEVLELKKLYSILEVRHMLLIKEQKQSCNQKYEIFLFFYSNDESCPMNVDNTAFILTYLRNKHDFVRVYSFDVDLESDIVKILKQKYGITECRAVVLNDEKLDIDLEDKEKIEELIV